MQLETFKLTSRALLLASLAAALPAAAHGATAARVDFAIGNVAAVDKAGRSRALTKGLRVEEGETILTNDGRAQLRFTDGAYVSLQPQSEFRIDQYRYAGKQDGSEKAFFSLLKGGLRTITGFVGRSNKKNYQVSTTVATIGIRGTEYTIQYGQSIRGTVGEGEIEVCNGAGCINVANGESYYVQNQDTKPVLTDKKTDLPPAQPGSPPADLKQGETVDASGFPALFALVGTQTLDLLKSTSRSLQSATMEFDANGTLLSIDGQPVESVTMGGNDGIMSWGTFVESSSGDDETQALQQALVVANGTLAHFVAGRPADLASIGTTTGIYTLIGSTPVTDALNQAVGTLDAAKLSVDFNGLSAGLNAATAEMFWTINGVPLSATLSGSGSNALSMSGVCGANCIVNADLAFFGLNAPRAGMVYDIAGSFVGAAAFAKQ